MKSLVEKILLETGPCLSTDITKILVEKYNIPYTNARQRVSRGCKDMLRLSGISFPRNARFVYLKKDFGSPWYWNALHKAMLDTKSAYGHAVSALNERNGIAPLDHFIIACGAPLKQKKHISSDEIVKRLEVAKVIKKIHVSGVGECVILAKVEREVEFRIPELKARLICEDILLKAISSWARKLGLISYKLIKLRSGGELPKVSTTQWDIVGPSYLSALITWGESEKPNPGFWACDILLDTNISVEGVQPFIKKCQALRSLKKVGKCVQMFVADSYQKDAFKLLKKAGVIPATPETLFGKEVAEGLSSLIKILINVAELSLEPEKFNMLFDQLGRIEGAAGNLRGALFEYLVAEVERQTERVESIRVNQKLKTITGKQAEVDIISITHDEKVRFIECKGNQPFGVVDNDEVEKWLRKRIPTLREYALQHPDWKHRELVFEMWTTGGFSAESIEKLSIASSLTGKYRIIYKAKEEVLENVRETRNKELLKTFKTHFMEHPISKVKNK